MCRLCCRCELCSLRRRTINSTTPCVLASSLTLRIFPGAYLMLLHYLCSSLLLLFRFTHGEIGSVGSACGILSGPSSHSILSSALLHAPSITQMFDCRLYHTFGMSLYFHISPVTFPLSHFHHAVTHPSTPRRKGGKGGKKKNIIITSPIQSYSIFVHCLTQSPHLSPVTLHPRHRPPRIVSTCLSDCPRAGLLLPPPCATPGIASLPLPGWASPWSPTALSMMSLLRQAKIY